jgi:hypothetical protein
MTTATQIQGFDTLPELISNQPMVGSTEYYTFVRQHTLEHLEDRMIIKVEELIWLALGQGAIAAPTRTALLKFAMDTYINDFPYYFPTIRNGRWGYGEIWYKFDEKDQGVIYKWVAAIPSRE